MFNISTLNSRYESVRRMFVPITAAIALVLGVLAPVLLQGTANAATLTSRSVTIATSQPAATGVQYNFAFTTTANFDIQSMIFQFCNTPLGTCVLPGEAVPSTNNGTDDNTEIDVSAATAAPGAFTGTTGTPAFAEVTTDTGACTDADSGSQVATMYCVNRTQTTDEIAGAKTFIITGITNPTIQSGNNQAIYVRISLFSDDSFASATDSGTVAASVVNQLTVTGRVQERLVFCVFALDDAAGSSGTVGTANGNFPTNCTANEATASSSVDIGVVDNLTVARSPVDNSPPSSLGNDRYGAAMINTNASNGVTLTYYATAATSGTDELRAFRVTGATCSNTGTSLVDQCFISADDTAGESLSAGTERFGMQMACVTNVNTQASAGTTANLGSGGNGSGTGGTFNTVYANGDIALAGDFEDDGSDDCESEVGTLVGWRDSGTAQALISSTSVVDDELVKMRFLATAAATTPTGTYTVATTYIATPVF